MLATQAGDAGRTVGASLTTTTETTIYTVVSTIQVVRGDTMKLCNTDTSNDVDVTVTWTDDSASQTTSLYVGTIPAKSYHDLDLQGMFLYISDTIEVTAGSANDIDVTLTVVEQARQT